MRFSTLASLLALTLASSTTAQFLNQTAPFVLVVYSNNATYNGTTLSACHEGAGIEGLCVGAAYTQPIPSSASTFTQNYSTTYTSNPEYGTLGYLTYELVGGNFNESESMSFEYNVASNVAVPLFGISESGQEISFLDDKLVISGYTDDLVTPPTYKEGVLDRWYICETYAGYDYTTLSWVLGEAKPQNPSCVKASVKRIFV